MSLAVDRLLAGGRGNLPLNPLFHYLPLLGYGHTSSHDFFETRLNGPDAFSQMNGGVRGPGQRFELQWDP